MDLILGLLAAAFIAATLLPLWKHEGWLIRIFDFPRAQIAAGGCLVTAAYLLLLRPDTPVELGLLSALALSTVYQGWRMIPYTPLFPRQVKSAAPVGQACGRCSILIANVLMENRAADEFDALIRENDPDVVLAVETDRWWVDRLSRLESSYPYTVKVPLSNTYGMTLLSRLEIVDSDVHFLVDDSIPSIRARLRLAEGPTVRLFCVHPRPPAPTEDTDTTERDAEILLVGRSARESVEPSIVMGDLNDVAWSYTTRLFQKISGLLDPRIGRGMFNTYHAGNPLMRWPLDHLFHSEHFTLVRMQRLRAWGSDHFPIFVRLQYAARAAEIHDLPEAEASEHREARRKIQMAT